MGNNGWCTGAASLSVTASEPLGGHSITLIEGTHNGSGFSCPGASCEVTLSQGQNDFTFWAHSTFGDTSSMGSASGKVDSQPPQVSPAVDKAVNAGFRGKWMNYENKGKSEAEIIALWNKKHPDDPVE
jgi:hypothetical protein